MSASHHYTQAFEENFTEFDHQRYGIEFFDGSHFVELKADPSHVHIFLETIEKTENRRKAMLRSVEHKGEFLGMDVNSVNTIAEASVMYGKITRRHMRTNSLKTAPRTMKAT